MFTSTQVFAIPRGVAAVIRTTADTTTSMGTITAATTNTIIPVTGASGIRTTECERSHGY